MGGAGVNILSAAGSASAEVNNASGASIYRAGNSVNINLLSGDATVVNEGELTSTAGRGVNVLTVTGEASATNSNSITAFSGGMVVVAGGDVDVNNDGSTISTTNGPGLSGSSLIDGNVDISNEGGSVTSTNGPGIVGFASAGDVDIESATGTVNSGGDGISGTALLSGNVWIDSGTVTSTGGSGVVGTSAAGNVDIDAKGNVIANGLFGVGAAASATRVLMSRTEKLRTTSEPVLWPSLAAMSTSRVKAAPLSRWPSALVAPRQAATSGLT